MSDRWRRIALFVSLSCAGSWALFGAFVLAGMSLSGIPGVLVGILYMCVPAVVSVALQRRVRREPVLEPLGVRMSPNSWFVVAWLLPVGVVLASLVVALLLPGVSWTSDASVLLDRFTDVLPPEAIEEARARLQSAAVHPFWPGLALALVAGATVNAVVAFGEELGWRGFLLREVGPLGFWRGSAFVGVAWGLWHAPLVLNGHNYPQHPVQGVFLMTVLCVLLSPVFSLVRERARSVVAVAVMHGTLNAAAVLPLVVLKGGDDRLVGVTGLSGFIVLVGVNVWVWWVRRPGVAPPGTR